MTRTSAGLLLYRQTPHGLEVLLVHPGGPFWARKDLGAWSIPKGEAPVDVSVGRWLERLRCSYGIVAELGAGIAAEA